MIKLGGVHFSLYSTPVFALLSLIMLYALGTAAWNWQAGLWAVVLLAVSYPQIHYGRTPFAEMFGQFWSLTTLYFGVAWLKQARPHLLVASLLAWAMAWATRGEALLLLAPIGLLLFAAALRRDVRSLAATAIALVPVAGLTALGTNRVYFDAQLGIYAVQWPWLKLVLPALILGMAVFLALAWVYRRQLLEWLPRVQRPASLLAIAASGFVVLWSTIPNPLRVPGVTRSYQEVVWFSSDYVTPLFYWLALAGTLWLIYRYRSAPTFLLALTTLVVAGVLFFRHTTSPYYPFALRRLTSEVFPLMALMAGVALTADWLPRPWPTVRPILGALLAVWMLVLSLPVIGQHESAGSVAFLQDLHQQTPAGAALIFEQQDDDSWVGWLAPPLYSVYGDNALLLHSDTPDPAALSGAVTALQSAGHPVYVVSQHDPLPAGLLPPGYQATLERTLHWRSSFIGHTRAPYPPPFWEFEFPVNFYRLQATATANNR